jgi:hypothetical protein
MTIDPVLCWAFGGAGVFALGFALLLARRPLRLIRAGGRARGRIGASEGRMISSSKGPSRMAYFPSVSFTTGKGEKVGFTSASGWVTAPEAGSEVAVLYDPASPKDAEISSFRTFWLFPVATAVMGLPFLLVGLACLF